MNACIYLRKSRKGDDQNETPAETLRRHREQLLALAEKMNLSVLNIKEEIMSGDSISCRPAMQELLEEVEEEKYDAVLVMDIDRLGRGSMIDQGIISRTFRESGTLVITPDKTYDLSDDLDEDFYDLYAFFARKELKQIKKRLQRGKIKSLKEGNFVWSQAPYGYLKSGRTEIIPHPENAHIVRDIFSWYLSGISMSKIADMLNEANISTSRGCRWTHKSISSILHNGEYAGDIIIGKTKLIKGRIVRQPKDAWTVVSGKHEPLISKEDFLRVQDKLSEKKSLTIPSGSLLQNPLSGIVFCGFCNAAMVRKSYPNGKDRLRCAGSCAETTSIRLHDAESRLTALILACMPLKMNDISFVSQKTWNKKDESSLDLSIIRKQNLEKRQKKIDQQLIRQHELLEQGVYDEETFLSRKSQLLREKEILKSKIEGLPCQESKKNLRSADCRTMNVKKISLKNIPNQEQEHPQQDFSLQSSADLLRSALQTKNKKMKNDLLKQMISHAEYYRSRSGFNSSFRLIVTLNF